MPIPADLVKIVWEFDLKRGGTVQDHADPGCHVQLGTPPAPADRDTFLNDLATQAWNAWQAHMLQLHYATNVSLAKVKASLLDTSAHVLAVGQATSGAGSWVGSDGGACLPWQDSQVVSLYAYEPGTFVPRAATKRGRIYLPPPAASILDSDHSGEIDAVKAQAVLSETRAMFVALEAPLSGSTINLAVVSATTNSWLHVGWFKTDSKLDTQRRRARQESADSWTLVR